MTPSASPWVRFQITFALAGGVVWFAGVLFHRDFVSGIGVGLVAAALLLRLGRRTDEDAFAEEGRGSDGVRAPSTGQD